MKWLQTLSVATAFISGLSLYYGSLGIPPDMQSYGGETARELAIKRRDVVLKWIGIPSASIAAISQIFSIWWPLN